MPALVVAGTDTDVGKTVFAAALVHALDALYWKPVQSGLAGPTDSATVARLGGVADSRILPERYCLRHPLSPHRAAELDGITIDVDGLQLPAVANGDKIVVIEAAGGVLVPLTRDTLQVHCLARWQAPVVLCARTRLGTINHSLLTIEALRARAIPILGIAFVGDPVPDTEATICAFGNVRRLGRLPWLNPLEHSTLKAAFAANFRISDFLGHAG